MRVDRQIMELAKADWLMSIGGVTAYAKIVHSIMSGTSAPIAEKTHALVTIIDSNGIRVGRNGDGDLKIPKGSVAIVDMIGPVMKYGDWCSYGAEEIVHALQQADDDDNIIGTIFNVDGPGGSVSSIGPFIEFAKNKKKPIVGLADQCASLHFWAFCEVADFRMATNNVSSSFGSVGVVSSFADNTKYLETLGYVFHEIYPKESEHKNLAYTLALKGDYEMIKEEHLSPIARKFQASVVRNCPKLKAEEVGVLTGKMFDADKALEFGMIDAIGSMSQAIDRVKIMSEINHYT